MVGRKLVFEIQLGLLIVSTSFSWYALAKGINVKPGFFSEGHAGAFGKNSTKYRTTALLR